MKKNGFTLIEILISLTLVSIVLVAMLSTLVRLKDVYAKANDDTDVRIYGAIISRTINADVLANGGIKPEQNDVVCASADVEPKFHSVTCNIKLNNGLSRILYLRVASTSSGEKENPSGNKYTTVINRSTIEYYDVENEEVLLLKTISSTDTYSIDGLLTESKYYHYSDISVSNPIIYESKNTNPDLVDVLRIITIKSTEPEFDINIYSAGTY